MLKHLTLWKNYRYISAHIYSSLQKAPQSSSNLERQKTYLLLKDLPCLDLFKEAFMKLLKNSWAMGEHALGGRLAEALPEAPSLLSSLPRWSPERTTHMCPQLQC